MADLTPIVAELEAIHSTLTILRNALRASNVEESQDAAALLDHAVVDPLYLQIERLTELAH